MHLRSSLAVLLSVTLAAACDGGLEPESVCGRGVCGTLHFRGAIPDSTDNVFMAAYVAFPQTCDDLIFNRQPFIPGSVPYTDSVTDYSIPLAAGSYAWVLAVWKKEGQLTLTPADTALLRVAGYYRDPADTAQPGAVTVPNVGAAIDIDFTVDFDQLRPATDFVTCSARQ